MSPKAESGRQKAEGRDPLPLRVIMDSTNQADEYRRLEELYAEMCAAQIEAMSD
jgi:hypothetical protein